MEGQFAFKFHMLPCTGKHKMLNILQYKTFKLTVNCIGISGVRPIEFVPEDVLTEFVVCLPHIIHHI